MISLYSLAEFIASFIETFICCKFCGIFQKNAVLKNHRIMLFSFLSATIAIFLNNVQLFSFLSTVVGILVFTIIQKILYEERLGNIIALVMVYIVAISGIDFFVVQVFSVMMKVDKQYLLNEQSVFRILCIIISKVFLILFFGIIEKSHKARKELPRKHIVIMCIIAAFSLASNFILIRLSIDVREVVVEALSLGYFVLSIVMVVSIFYLFLVLTDNYEQKKTLALLDLQNRMVVKSQNEAEHVFNLWRNSIHDYKNNVIALKNLIDEEKMDEVKQYLDNEYKLMDQKLFCIKTGNSVVDAIINTKQNIAENKGITFTVNAKVREDCYISSFDMASILGNLLDNAIEVLEREHVDNSYIEVTIKEKKRFLIIKVKNSFYGEMPEEYKTTKEEKAFHGLGIQSVKNIVRKYNGDFEIKHEEDEVIAVAMILDCAIKE